MKPCPLTTHRNFKIPYVGEGVTYGWGSDRYPATIIEVSKNLRTIVIQDDTATPIKEGYDYYSNQKYDITPNPEGGKQTFTWRDRGVWVKKGLAKASGFLSFSGRDKYSDPSF